MRWNIAICLIMVLSTTKAFADGKFFSERVPPGLPYQRAILIFDEGRQTLVLQSKAAGAEHPFGWVVPLPNAPDLDQMSWRDAEEIFLLLVNGVG